MQNEPGKNTLGEILSQPAVWRQCLDELARGGRLQELNEELPRDIEYVFIGCGSSYYLAQAAAATWTLVTGGNARALPASEIVLFPKLLPSPCQPILISRSGFTSEILEAARYLEGQLELRCLAISCAPRTALESIAERTLCLPAADEKSTVMTRSYTSMLLTLQWFAAVRAHNREILDALLELPAKTEALLAKLSASLRTLADSRTFADYVFLGQGPFHGVAQEAMLKVKEMSCSYAQCFHTLEFRHGPKSIVSPETLITFFISDSASKAETDVLTEVKALGGSTLVIANRASPAARRAADDLVEFSLDSPELARLAPSVIPAQFLGFYTGLRKGLDPDEPRNLTRVVMLGDEPRGGPSRVAP